MLSQARKGPNGDLFQSPISHLSPSLQLEKQNSMVQMYAQNPMKVFHKVWICVSIS